ncbi:MAG: hypothetical protein KF819_39495 [Labilithrix sp.]|nr:hypothetical protein [Labilithrix sp.]
MPSRHFRSFGLVAALAVAAGSAFIHCSAPEEEDEELTEDAITGVNNALGLGLRYDDKTGRVQASLKTPLKDGEKLFIRVRRGKITLTSQKELACEDLTQARPLSGVGDRELTGNVVYQGPKVDKSIFDLVHLYDDPNWATGDVAAQIKADIKKYGPDPIVEACILKGDKVRAKLQTNLAYAWDQGTKAEATNAKMQSTLGIRAGDAGLGGDGGEDEPGVENGNNNPQGNGRAINETNVSSQIEYGELCVQELGEIPFFKKRGQGKYDTFDCRNLVGMDGDTVTGAIDGVEGAGIPVTVDGVAQTKCSPGRELGLNSESYGCMDKADHGMYLATGQTQPGPMVVTAKNDKGTHWLLLCRKVADDGSGMMNTTVFNDMAMIGTNPKTGRTCFFQNSIGSGRDGKHVPHPADVEKSTTVWSTSVQSYCSGQCHGADAFVHSRWIDGAKRSNGKPIVPKQGEHPDFLISDLSAPYSIIAGDKLGFSIPKQLVSDEAGPCINCHRVASNSIGSFARWSTGTGEDYFRNITDFGKKFEESHWMPPRLDGLTEANWATSKYGKALEHLQKCSTNAADPECIWADVPRGEFNNPAVR